MFGHRRRWAALSALVGTALALLPATLFAQRRVTDVQVAPPEATVQVGQTTPFVAQAFDNANNIVASAVFQWSSSNPRAATVDQNGIATGVGPGSTIITARTGTGRSARSGQAALTVLGSGPQVVPQAQPNPPIAAVPRPSGPGCAAWERQPPGSGTAEALIFDSLRLTLVRGETRQLGYRAMRSDGQNAARVCILFAIDPGGEKVATVDSFGVVVANDTGRAVVRASVPGRSGPLASKQISVEVRGDSVRFEVSERSVTPGSTDTLAMVVPAQHRMLNPIGIFQFTSSDTSKVRVSPIAPIVFAVAPGTARLAAQSSIYPDLHVLIHVHRPVAHLVGTPPDSTVTLAVGGSESVGARALAADSTAVAEAPLHWVVSDTTVARMDPATGTLHGLKMGETRLSVSAPAGRDSSLTRQWRVRVVAGGLLLTRTRVVLGVGERTPLPVQLLDDRRQPVAPATQLAWTSTADSVAHVADGQVVATGMGRVRLTGRAPWDSTVSAEVYVVGDLLVSALRGGRVDLFMFPRGDPARAIPVTQDSAVEQWPAWSPGLMQLAYAAAPPPGTNVFDLFVTGYGMAGGPKRLTWDSAMVRSPSFVPPVGNQVVFESSKGGRSQLYVINADGTGRRALDPGEYPNSQPSVSPDGRKVAFVSLREKNYDIYEVNLDGTGERRLTTAPTREDTPVYAADGRSIYYLREETGSPPTKRVYRQELVSGAATPITPAGMYVSAFSVSADGSQLALTELRPKPDGTAELRVALFDVAGGAQTPVVIPGAERLAGAVFRPATPQPR